MSTSPNPVTDFTNGLLTSDAARLERAHQIVVNNSRWAAGLGFIPVPLLDWAAITGIQLRMLHQLASTYSANFDQARAARYIAALVGGMVPASIGYSIGSLLKAVPILGGAYLLAIPATAYATTYAIGEVFIPHFETGGNLYSFDPASQRALFAHYYSRGKAAAEAAGQA